MSFRSRLRPLKRALAGAVEHLWRPVIAGFERVSPAREHSWTAGGRVLVVAPHPDDEAIGCAGTLLRHVAAGDHVCIAIATDGRRSRAVADPDAMAALRQVEAEKAAGLLGVAQLGWIGAREGEWQPHDLRDAFARIIENTRPSVIYAPSRVDFHPEHHAVAHALALALADDTAPRAVVRVYQVQVPLTAALVNLRVDVSAFEARRSRVIAAYASQAGTIASADRLRRYCSRGARCVESFWQLDGARYVSLHRDPPTRWSAAFRGLRPFPLTDPLAWLAGGTERRRIAGPAD
jgi:LmbE family N-acetylglucosaminyl deacetylase